MASIDYPALRQIVLQAIADAADATEGLVTIRRITDGAAGSTPWKPATPTYADEVVLAVVASPKDSKRREGDGREGTGSTLVPQAQAQVLIAASVLLGPAPTTADLVVVRGRVLKVLTVETIAPGGIQLLHKVEVGA